MFCINKCVFILKKHIIILGQKNYKIKDIDYKVLEHIENMENKHIMSVYSSIQHVSYILLKK